jgi:uncharacterized repeat protein (TIGR02543 family)
MGNNSTWTLESNSGLSLTSSTGTALTLRIYGHSGTGSPGANTANWRIDDLKLYVGLSCITPQTQTASAVAASVCSGTSTNIQLSNSQTGVSYQLRNNADNSNIGSPVSGTGAAISLTTGNLSAATTFNVLATSVCGATQLMSGTPTVAVNTCYTITYEANEGTGSKSPTTHVAGDVVTLPTASGITRTNYNFIGWNTQANGSGTFYTAGTNITINSDITLYARWGSVQAAPGSKFWIGGNGNWNVNANWEPTGKPVSGTENVYIEEGSPVMNENFTVGSSKDLTLSGTASLIINPGITLTITGTADFGDRPVTLKSTSAGTASIGQISNDGANLTGATAVTVERYIQARRKWRALTTPLIGSSNNSVFYNWQNNGANNGAGVMIWSPLATTGSGVYQTGAGTASSMLTYNTSTNNWSPVANTNNAKLFDAAGNNPYMVFVTGPYNATGNYVTSGVAATTLKATGTIRKGTITYNNVVASEKFYMFGNPYPSAINLKNATRTGFTNFVYTWNPGLQSVGGYETRSLTANQTIESGQAFFLQDDATVVGNLLEFEEADKINVSSQTYFRTSEDPSYAQISIDLNKYVSGALNKYDNATCDFMQGGNAGLDENDALKPTQFNENMSIYRAGKDLSWETRPVVADNDTLQLRMWAMKEASYQLKIDMSNFQLPAGSTAVVQDQFLGKETILNLTGTTLVDFNVNANAASAGQRFRVVFRSNIVTPVTNLNEVKELAIYPNPVVKGADIQLEFRNKAAGKYTVKIFNITGVQVQQAVVRHIGGTAVHGVGLEQRLVSGNYLVEILNEKGEREQARLTIQ